MKKSAGYTKISRRAFWLLAFFLPVFLFAACARPGPDTNIALDEDDCAACQRIFPQGGWQFVHEIVFRFAKGEGRFLGIVAFDEEELRCALTTLEGLTVFVARAPLQAGKGEVQVERALPPLDKSAFAVGLVADLRLLFIAPAGAPRCGWRHGTRLCRWENPGVIQEISVSQDGCWSIQVFKDGRLFRTARATGCAERDGYLIPGSISLYATGGAEYELTMRLVSGNATPVKREGDGCRARHR
ncbi:MAG TPA: hypothetical protein DEB25_06315 [Desulfobulbaceae bacterium]|nr:hypothetical protein [Desulfobulbaceae bacterium]